MTSGQIPPRVSTKGVVLVAHGGQTSSTASTSPLQPAVLRMIPVAVAIRMALRGSGAAIQRHRFRVRGWNGALASPVADLNEALDGVVAEFGSVPVVLVGHSMGARAAVRAAGHSAVTAVAGLAPWLPPGEPVGQLAGRRVLLAHGSADSITSPAETWAFLERAREGTEVSAVEVRDGDHAMLRRARLWHAIAAEFARAALALPPGDSALAATVTATSGSRTVL
ncbi:MAG TPA: alpha/beta fold hydrolase [Streptosporangiaceae bacterium]